MKLAFSALVLFLCPQIFAQITVAVADHANANDTVRFSQAAITTLDLQTTGPNAIWDFSQLSAQTQTIKNGTKYTKVKFQWIWIY